MLIITVNILFMLQSNLHYYELINKYSTEFQDFIKLNLVAAVMLLFVAIMHRQASNQFKIITSYFARTLKSFSKTISHRQYIGPFKFQSFQFAICVNHKKHKRDTTKRWKWQVTHNINNCPDNCEQKLNVQHNRLKPYISFYITVILSIDKQFANMYCWCEMISESIHYSLFTQVAMRQYRSTMWTSLYI